jgi:hypothetical protein
MGREKEYRQRLKYQVASARKKTLENQIAVELKGDLGMSETEARLLAARMGRWLLSRPDVRGPEQIVVDAVAGRSNFIRNGRGTPTKVRLTPLRGDPTGVETTGLSRGDFHPYVLLDQFKGISSKKCEEAALCPTQSYGPHRPSLGSVHRATS